MGPADDAGALQGSHARGAHRKTCTSKRKFLRGADRTGNVCQSRARTRRAEAIASWGSFEISGEERAGAEASSLESCPLVEVSTLPAIQKY